MNRAGHYMEPAPRRTVPGVIFGVAIEARLSVRPNMPHVTIKSWMSGYTVVVYRTRGGWSRPQGARHGTPESLHSWLFERSLVGRINWVVCPVGDECLTLSRWFEYATQRATSGSPDQGRDLFPPDPTGAGDRWSVERLVVQGARTIVQYTDRGRRWRWCSAGNWGWDVGSGGGDPVGAAVEPPTRTTAGGCCGISRSAAAAGDCAERLRRLAEWWSAEGRGPLGVTVGACASSALRATSPPRTWCTHDVPEAKSLERAACFGGRASVWYYGNVGTGVGQTGAPFGRWEGVSIPSVPGPVTQVDFRQMYGSIMRDEELPYKLITVRQQPSVREVLQSCERNGVIARVRIRTDRPEYPYRSSDRVTYPVGEFTTTLTGVELLELATHGELLECHEMALYHRGSVASAYARWLTDPSTRDRCARAVGSKDFPKRLLNSLAGRLAMRPGRWRRSPERDEPGRWGEGREVSRQTDRTTRVRWIAGLAYSHDDDEESAGPYAAAFAYVAAWGRVRMARLRARIPARAVVSQDTDGCWILGSSTQISGWLSELVGPEPGQLRIEGSVDNARWYSPRHYCVDGSWTLSGMHFQPGATPDPEAWHVVNPSLWDTHSTVAPTESVMIARKSKLRGDVGTGRLRPDGWVDPPVIKPRLDGPRKRSDG